MSNLTGQQIKDTYEGLLNLQDSTTGITNSFQAIQDGLGNDTGAQIKQDGFYSNNLSAGTYNDIFEYPGRWTPPTYSATTSADYGNTGTTGFFLSSTNVVADTNLTGLSAATDSNVYPVPFYLYKGEMFRGITLWVRSGATTNAKIALYQSVMRPGNFASTGIQSLAPGQLVTEIGEINCSVGGLKSLDFTTPYVVPYTGVYFIMIKIGATANLRLAGQNSFIQLPQGRWSSTQNAPSSWRVDNAPLYTINQSQPYQALYYTNRTYADPFPTTFDYTTNSSAWAQGITLGLFYENQFQEI
jgi:hypothetical protein